MKKILFAMAVCMMAMSFTACSNKTEAGSVCDSSNVCVDSVEVVDSLVVDSIVTDSLLAE